MPREIKKVEVIERDDGRRDAPPRVVIKQNVVYTTSGPGCLLAAPFLLIKMPFLLLKTYLFARRAAREMAQAQGLQQKDVVITISPDERGRRE
ncbi:MAG TPA: hypothetical protein P5077_13000 [bacterium]|nr:hypothetical protein [bacterium]